MLGAPVLHQQRDDAAYYKEYLIIVVIQMVLLLHHQQHILLLMQIQNFYFNQMFLYLILVLTELHNLTARNITTQTSKVQGPSKTLELAHILGVRDISLSQYNYWNKRLQHRVKKFGV